MLTFFVLFKEKKINGQAIYIKSEKSFYYEPWNIKADFSIMIGRSYNSLDIDLKEHQALQLTGFNSDNNWIKQKLIIPNYNAGNLYLNFDKNYQSGTGVQYTKDWLTYFDHNTGWICIGNPNLISGNKSVEFASNTVAVVNNEQLQSIWIKPIFI